jgi:hypothetical protein
VAIGVLYQALECYKDSEKTVGLKSAMLMISGLLAALITITLVNISSPSNSVNSWLITLSVRITKISSPSGLAVEPMPASS